MGFGGKVKIKRLRFHNAGFNEVRKGVEVRTEIRARAEAVAAAATSAALAVGFPDAEFVVVESEGKSRVRFVVVTANIEAMLAEAHHRVLTRSLGAAYV